MSHLVIPVHHLPAHGVHTVRVERIKPAHGTVQNEVHRHDFHEVFFFLTGMGEHMIDLEPVPLQPPCVHLVAPGQVHQLTRSADATGIVVMFGESALMATGQASPVPALFNGEARHRAFALSPAMLAEVQGLTGSIERELEQAEGLPAEQAGPVDGVVLNYLGILLMKSAHWRQAALPKGAAPMDQADPVQRFVRLVERGFLEKRQVGAYAQELALSPGRLNELVKKRLGKSASEVIQDRLLLEAKRLLLHADLSMKEVSYALWIQDPAYFNRLFKKATGLTPAEYRTQVREKYKR